MHIFDVFDAWLHSMSIFFKNSCVTTHVARAPTDRSYSLNLRRNEREVDLVIWESGEAELIIGAVGESINQMHFDDIRNRADLSNILMQLAEFAAKN